MRGSRRLLVPCLLGGIATLGAFAGQGSHRDDWVPRIPRVWDDQAMASLEVPLAYPVGSPRHVAADYYYKIPVRPIYKAYPVYAPGKEPSGYMEWLARQEPQIAFDASKLKTEEEWRRAGELVFDSPIAFDEISGFIALSDLRDPDWYGKTRAPVLNDGSVSRLEYVIREKGKIELGQLSCALCHTRVMPDGSAIKGAQGNFPVDRAFAYTMRKHYTVDQTRAFERALYGVPWLKPDPQARLPEMTTEQIASVHDAVPQGVMSRHRTSPYSPVQVPDLIGVRDRRYLDRTGLQLHRSAADLMRYAALNQGADDLASYAGFIPAAPDLKTLPEPSTQSRYSDEQLYALVLYLYSLKPPPNPNKFDAAAERGRQVFNREGCAACHMPPLYTNNRLTPAEGFAVPDDHLTKYEITRVSVHTDSALATRTRRGTGYYKVPSLKGVWYRGPFEHSGSVATLEDWFDPRRLRDDYVPAGFKGTGIKTRAVRGHAFGLGLSEAGRKDLIAFLKTL